jgi:hypothetical protein
MSFKISRCRPVRRSRFANEIDETAAVAAFKRRTGDCDSLCLIHIVVAPLFQALSTQI